jgi:hypothetical protein
VRAAGTKYVCTKKDGTNTARRSSKRDEGSHTGGRLNREIQSAAD